MRRKLIAGTVAGLAGIGVISGCAAASGSNADAARPAAAKPAAVTKAAKPKPKPKSWTMPNETGKNLQAAQNDIQSLTGHAIEITKSHDATGQGRLQVLDRDWKVVGENPKAGSTITASTSITFSVVKFTDTTAARAATPVPAASPAAPAAAPAPAPAPATTSQEQALTSARTYLSLGSGFSRAGLIQQLTSPDGDHFGQADAEYAADHAGANWDNQAVLAARSYLGLGSGFSQAGLLAQLESADGGQFTASQAEYGVEHAGANWDDQAALAAKSYVHLGTGISRDDLLAQLESPDGGQFTASQAEYGVAQAGL